MSSIALPSIRNTVRICTPHLRAQKRWARVHDVRFVATQRDQQQVLNRYKEKLKEKAQKEGVESINDLKEVYKDKIAQYRRTANTLSQKTVTEPPKDVKLQQPPPPPPQVQQTPSQANTPKSTGGTPGIKPLSSYLDLEKIATLPRKEIEYLWRLRHANDSKSLCAVIPLETYYRIYATARRHPQFILPLPRPAADDGSGDVKQAEDGFSADAARTAADIHFLQWGFHPPASPPQSAAPGDEKKNANTHISTVLFTHLAAFKLHGAYAQPHTIVTHHLDLADSHGIVLLNGSVTDGKGVSVDEARWLLMCLQKFYDVQGHGGGIGKEKRQGLLEQFTQGDKSFNLEELVDEAERVS